MKKDAKKVRRGLASPLDSHLGDGAIRTFFACTKKVPKKYAEGVRTLSTPGDAVKLRLRFAPQVLRRYWKFRSFIRRKNAQFLLAP